MPLCRSRSYRIIDNNFVGYEAKKMVLLRKYGSETLSCPNNAGPLFE